MYMINDYFTKKRLRREIEVLNEEKAIVSNVAGTTRDAIDSYFENDKGKYNFIDTAGIRDTEDVVEKIGVNIYDPKVIEEYSKHKMWKERNNVDATPTIVYNDHKLPKFYNVEDFIYLDSEG